jgi:hypothetical protein
VILIHKHRSYDELYSDLSDLILTCYTTSHNQHSKVQPSSYIHDDKQSKAKQRREDECCFSLRGSVMPRPIAVPYTLNSLTHSFYYFIIISSCDFDYKSVKSTNRSCAASTLLRSRRLRPTFRCCTTLSSTSPQTPTPSPTSIKYYITSNHSLFSFQFYHLFN